jgi:hypothetical protein
MISTWTLPFAATILIAISFLNGSDRQLAAQAETPAAEFKIITEVFLDGSTTPVSINQTLFPGGLVFDFRLSTTGDTILESTVFDERNQRFVLLDPQREIRLQLDNLQLLRFVEGMKQELQNSEETAFLVFDDAEEEFQPDAHQVIVKNQYITYRASGYRPEDDRLLQNYYEFLAYYTRLSTTDPRRLPPFARMGLNRAMKKYGILPSEVGLELRESGHPMGSFTAVSKHRIVASLDDVDRQRIQETKENWMRFRPVGLAEYRELEQSESR